MLRCDVVRSHLDTLGVRAGHDDQFGRRHRDRPRRRRAAGCHGIDRSRADEFTRGTDNDLIFGRIDANPGLNHQLTVRHNFVDGKNQVLFPSGTFYTWPNYVYNIDIKTNSFVTQLNSVFGDDKFNELRSTAQTIKGPRFGPQRVPAVRVDLADGRDFQSGTERFSTANNLDQAIFEITDDLTLLVGQDHTVIVGTHLQFFKFNNLFIRENFGSYRFDSLDDLELGRAQAFDYSFSNPSNPQQAAEFSAADLAFYAGDNGLANAVGTTIERNGSRAPWRNYTDMKIAWQLPIAVTDIEISLDIRNFLNLLNNEWGRVQYANFNELSPFRYMGQSPEGLPMYRLNFVALNPDRKFSTDDLRSRWQMRFGARVSF